MTKIDIISGFLGAGKTTLIKKFLEEALIGEKVVLIENEYGEIGIDGSILKDYGIEIKEMNSGCICCTIAGDFSLALKDILTLYNPDRIIIEPSGVGKLSDVINGCRKFLVDGSVELNMCIAVVDCIKYKMYLKNFAEFYKNQLTYAKTIILSRTQNMKTEAVDYILQDIKKYNPNANVVTTEWEKIDGKRIIELAENKDEKANVGFINNLGLKFMKDHKHMLRVNVKRVEHAEHAKCSHEGHHHADEIFQVWGKETAKIFNREKINNVLNKLDLIEGNIVRAKGIVRVEDNQWIQFDYVPEEVVIRETTPDYTGRICVIGEKIDDLLFSELFEV